MTARGAFIVVEGCDRCGKSTQCKNLVSALNKKKIPADYMHFPDRSTTIGKVIDDYLSGRVEINHKVIHLLFSANRWELEPEIKENLSKGVTLIVDRYSYSGVAYSSIKSGMDIDWCKNPESGLPKPDLVLFLTLSQDEAQSRSGFGDERYETKPIQEAVSKAYGKMEDDNWVKIEANKPINELTSELLEHCLQAVESAKNRPLSMLCNLSDSDNEDDAMED